MDRKEIEECLAPCGLDCSRCVARKGSTVNALAKSLAEALTGFDVFAQRRAGMIPAFTEYGAFKDVLSVFTTASCGGCRGDNHCGIQGCVAKQCAADGVAAFCGECENFPCGRNDFPPDLETRWHRMGERIREVGAAAFYEEQASKSRC